MLVAIIATTFLVIHLVPGDPARTLAGADAPPDVVAKIRSEYRFDRPLPAQFLTYLNRLLHADLGVSYTQATPVSEVISRQLPPTLLLTGTALALSTAIGVSAGLAAARRPRTMFDQALNASALVAYAVPGFWLAQIAIIFLVFRLPLFPLEGYSRFGYGAPTGVGHLVDVVHHLILPAVVLATTEVAAVSRLVRSGLLAEGRKEYARTAEAKGLASEVVLSRHVLRNALLPVVTLIGTRIGFLFSGAVVIESIFSWPGLGSLIRSAAQNNDNPLMLGVVLLVSGAILAMNIVTDVVYAWVDPRVSLQ